MEKFENSDAGGCLVVAVLPVVVVALASDEVEPGLIAICLIPLVIWVFLAIAGEFESSGEQQPSSPPPPCGIKFMSLREFESWANAECDAVLRDVNAKGEE